MVDKIILPDSVAAVQRMQTYIENNLLNPITLKDLANSAGYSPFHAARIFKQFTGRAPFDYIRSLRLSKAALNLKEDEKTIMTVALEFVFSSHEGFTRAFSRQFGVTPNKYRKESQPIRLFMPYSAATAYQNLLKGEKLMFEKENTQTIFVQVIERPARKLILKRGRQAEDYFSYCEEVTCAIWDVLCNIKDALYEPVGVWLPDYLIKPGTSRYVQGVELPLDYDKPLSEGLEIIELSAFKMMVFQGEPYDDADFEKAIGAIWSHIHNFDPKLYGYEWALEQAPRFQLEPQGYRGYIEMWPVRMIV